MNVKHYPLTVIQSDYFLDWDQNHSMTQYNMAGYMSFQTNCIDRERLEKAFEKMLSLNPYLYNRFVKVSEDEVPPLKYYNDPTRLIRQYPETNQEMKMNYKEMSDAELDAYIHHATPPFDLFHEPMMRATLVRTPTHDVLVYDFFHSLMDGVSIRQFITDMATLYQGDEIEPQGMRFYEIAEKQYEAFDSEQYLTDKRFNMEKLKNISCYTDFCKADDITESWGNSLFGQKKVPMDRIKAWAKANNYTLPAFLMAVYAKTLSEMTGEKKVVFFTYYHGRSPKEIKKSLYGQLTFPMLLVFDIDQHEDIKSLIEKVKINLMDDLRHGICPIYHTIRELGIKDNYGTDFLYNGPYMDFFVCYEGNTAVWEWFDSGVSMDHLDFCIYQDDKRYIIDVTCSDALYTREQVDKFMKLYIDTVERIIS